MINQHSWMFLSSYEKLREKLIRNVFFDTNLHLGSRTFPEIGGEVVQNASFTFWNKTLEDNGVYFRLVDLNTSELKRLATVDVKANTKSKLYFNTNQKDFEKIPGSPIGYWLSENALKTFQDFKKISEIADLKQGMATTNNDYFMRRWFECSQNSTSFDLLSSERTFDRIKWVPYSKGGTARKWYGNQEYIVNFKNDGQTICDYIDNSPGVKVKSNGRVINRNSYFKPALTWSLTSSNGFCVRFRPAGSVFDVNGMSLFVNNENDFEPLLALMNSNVAYELLKTLNPTLAFQKGDIEKLPATLDFKLKIDIKKIIEISKTDWDSREISWDFAKNQLMRHISVDLEETYDLFQQYWKNKFFQLHKNEEELNRQFIEIYGLNEELSPDVQLEDITILKEETVIENGQLVFKATEVFAQFMSYAVGCMFGRYSLDKEGLILANQGETLQEYLEKVALTKDQLRFTPDDDNIIPVLDDEWFEDDITGRFYAFLKASFGTFNFDKNLAFVEECLGKDIRKYFVKDFYSDHIKRYKKRPIYWMFSSPKGSFNVLLYMHRYTPDTLNKILNEYLIQFREKLNTRIEHLDHLIVSGSPSEQTRAQKEKDKLKLVILELIDYERDILRPLAIERITIDLDEGVLVNYNKFGKAIKDVDGLNDAKTKKKVKAFDWINVEEIR
jgi:hypothetical protein